MRFLPIIVKKYHISSWFCGKFACMAPPRKYTCAVKVQKIIDKYFADMTEQGRPWTITGLAVALDTTRLMLCQWAAEEGDIANAIKNAKGKVEAQVEEMMMTKGHAGLIFWMKNHGWKDKQEHDHRISKLEDLIAGDGND